jgi:tRNA pseudouridine13 synthase
MRLKQRVGDFRVRELLARDTVQERGPFRVYRVTKRKLTSDEAARELAREAGVEAAEVALAGLKDRQGITIQYMTVPGGREVRLEQPDLRIETVGFAERPLVSADSEGNAFELTVRALRREDVARLRSNLPLVREHGTLNYFDEQRFGNLTHGQGWLYRDLCLGRHEGGLRNLLGAPSPRDDERHRRFKEGLRQHWGDWRACRDVAGRFGAHHSVFEHLAREPEDFAGAFAHIATRIKLIHLYAWQSYLWNRAVAELVREAVPMPERVLTEGVDGPLVGFSGSPPAALLARRTFPLPGDRLEGVPEADQRYFQAVLEREGLPPAAMAVDGIPGFALKPELRELFLLPRHLRVRPAETDNLNHGFQAIRVRFELPRGGYATLVVKRLFSTPLGEREERPEESPIATGEEDRGGPEGRPGERGGERGGGRGRAGGRHDSYRRGGHRPHGAHRDGGRRYDSRGDDARDPDRPRPGGDRPGGDRRQRSWSGKPGSEKPWPRPFTGGPGRQDRRRGGYHRPEEAGRSPERRPERDDRGWGRPDRSREDHERGRGDDRGRPGGHWRTGGGDPRGSWGDRPRQGGPGRPGQRGSQGQRGGRGGRGQGRWQDRREGGRPGQGGERTEPRERREDTQEGTDE